MPHSITTARLSRLHLAALLFLVTMSAVWVQTDLYRYSISPLLLWGLYSYLRQWHVKPRFHWLELLCIAWPIYVVFRVGSAWWVDSVAPIGQSEGLYLSPILFGVTGYAMFRARTVLADILPVFFAISLLMLIVSTDYVLLASGDALAPLFQSNSIHGAVSAGLVLIGAAGWLVHVWSDHAAPAWRRRLLIAIAIGVIGLAALGVLGAKSKGVWIAMILVALIETGFAFVSVPSRRDKVAALVPIVVVAVVCFILSDRIAAVAAETMAALRGVIFDMVTTSQPLVALKAHIDAHVAPESAQVRLELLYNALTVWREHFWFGAGPEWVKLMSTAPYTAGGFTTIHNAFLEIAVRYGLLGLLAIGTIVIECVRLARHATRRGLLRPVAFHTYAMLVLFYLLAGLTNSNSHFAFGEAFVLLSCGFGLFCLFLVRTDEAREPVATERPAHFV